MVQRAGRRWRAFYLTSIMVVSTIFYSVAVGPVGADHNFSFGAAGDLDRNTRTTANLRSISTTGLSFFAALGDFSYNGSGTEAMWCDYVKSYVGDAFPFELISGNHEDNGPDGIIDNFANCLPDRIGGITGVYAKEYYFDYPATSPLARMIFISPNLNFTNGGYYTYKVNGEHYNWTRDAIDDARARGIRWVIVGMHKACIATGGQTCESMAVTNLLLQRKVDLVLQAHDHNYQRSKQLSCATVGIYTEACVVSDGSTGPYIKGTGTVFVIAGTGGAGRTQVNEQDPEFNYFAKVDNTTYGYVKYSVSHDRIDAEFVPTSGIFPDRLSTDRFSIVLPDFTMVPNPDSLSIMTGSSGTSAITLTSNNGFSGTIELTASVSSAGLTASLSRTSLTLSEDQSTVSTLTIDSSMLGTYIVTVTGISGSLSHSISLTVAVTDFSISSSPSSLTLGLGSSETSTISLTSLNGFSGDVSLTASVTPAGSLYLVSPTASVAPSVIRLAAGETGTSTLTVRTSLLTTPGTYTLTVEAKSGSLSRSTTVEVTVTLLG